MYVYICIYIYIYIYIYRERDDRIGLKQRCVGSQWVHPRVLGAYGMRVGMGCRASRSIRTVDSRPIISSVQRER